MKFMLCKPVTEQEFTLRSWSDYSANIKYDGERIIAIKEDDKVDLLNRRDVEKSAIYPEITQQLKKIPNDFIIDGEVITFDGKFNTLQHRAGVRNVETIKERVKSHPVKFMVFDILELDGVNQKNFPLKDRIEKMEFLNDIENVEIVRYFEDIDYLWDKAKEEDWEGIIIKDMNADYEFRRSDNWLKLKNFKEKIIEFDGYETNPAGIKLNNGFNKVQVPRLELVKKIKEIIDNGGKVKVNVQYLEKTESGKLRMPSCKEVLLD